MSLSENICGFSRETLEGFVLNYLIEIDDKSVTDTFSDEMFQTPIYWKIFKAIQELQNNDLPVSVYNLVKKLNDTNLNVNWFIEFTKPSFIEYPAVIKYFREIVEKEKALKDIEILHKEAKKDPVKFNELPLKLEEVKDEILNSEKNESDLSSIIFEVVNSPVEERLFETKYPTLNSHCFFKRGQFIVIGGRTGVGKTAFVCNLALQISNQGKKVYFASLEQTKEEILKRIACIKLNKLKSAYIRKDLTSLIDEKIIVSDKPKQELSEIALKAYQSKSDVLIIDNIQLLNLEKIEGDNKVQKLEKITADSKSIAKEYQMTIIMLSQLNREYEKLKRNTPVLADLRDSGSIEQDADIVLLLFEKDNEIFLRVAKNREGEDGDIRLNFDKEKGIINEA